MIKVWYSTESIADYIIDHTLLNQEMLRGNIEKKKLYESDASRPANFHSLPTHIKQILYLDSPDLIIEKDSEPVFSLEISTEAGTGHNAFQRFARIAAAVENNVPAFYVYPEAGYIYRNQGVTPRWDKINPLIFDALEKAMRIYNVPALLYYFPSHFRSGIVEFPRDSKGLLYDELYPACPLRTDREMQKMFSAMNAVLRKSLSGSPITGFMGEQEVQERRDYMVQEMHSKMGLRTEWSPITATVEIETGVLIEYLKRFSGPEHSFGDLLNSREKTLIYKVDADFRGDPYPGAVAAIDYIKCRKGKTFEDRHFNLVMAWGEVSFDESGRLNITGNNEKSVKNFINAVKNTYTSPGKVLLNKDYDELSGEEIPRYFMQVRFGTTFTKVKHIRVYSYFCDAVLFHDGALWREG